LLIVFQYLRSVKKINNRHSSDFATDCKAPSIHEQHRSSDRIKPQVFATKDDSKINAPDCFRLSSRHNRWEAIMNANKPLIRICALIAVALLLAACSEQIGAAVGQLKGQMAAFFEIKSAIDKTLASGECSLHIQNGRVITLGLVNTELNDAAADVRKSKAEELGNFLLEQIADRDQFKDVTTIVVSFVHYEKKYLLINYTESVDHYVFQLS
jgi:hypothetical protein